MAGREKNTNHKHLMVGHSLIKKKKKKVPHPHNQQSSLQKEKVIFKHQSLVIFPSKTTEQH